MNEKRNVSKSDCAQAGVYAVIVLASYCSSSWLSVQRLCELTERTQWQTLGQKRDIPVVKSS